MSTTVLCTAEGANVTTWDAGAIMHGTRTHNTHDTHDTHDTRDTRGTHRTHTTHTWEG